MLYCEREKIHLSPFWIGLQFLLCQTSKNLAPIDRMMAHFSQMRREEEAACLARECQLFASRDVRLKGQTAAKSLFFQVNSTHLPDCNIGVKAS